MNIRTIEQKMGSASLWNGAAPSGGLVRSITHDAADNVVAATKVWQFTNGAFTDDDVGRLFLMGATGSGNDGLFTIAQVNSPTEIESVEAPNADETFGVSVTQDVYDPSGTPSLGDDLESFVEGVTGGLFDFGNDNPIFLQQILVRFGSGTTSWSLSLVDVDSVETQIASGANADPLLSTRTAGALAGLIILEGQKLKLVSAGGPTTASVARVSVSTSI